MSDVPPSHGELRRLTGSRPRYSIHQQNCAELREMRNAAYNQAHANTTASRRQGNLTISGNAFSATLGRRERALYIERVEPRFVELHQDVVRLNAVVNTHIHRDTVRDAELTALREELAALREVNAALQIANREAITLRDARLFELTSHLQAVQQQNEDLINDGRRRDNELLALRREYDRERSRRIQAEGRKQVAEHYFPTQPAMPIARTPAILSMRSVPSAPLPTPVASPSVQVPARPRSPTPAASRVVGDEAPRLPSFIATPTPESGHIFLDDFLDMTEPAPFNFLDVASAEADVPDSASASVVGAAPAVAAPMAVDDVGATTEPVMATPTATPAPAAVRTAAMAVPPLAPALAPAPGTARVSTAPAQPTVPFYSSLRGPANYSPVTPHHNALQGPLEGDDAADELFPPSVHFQPTNGNFVG